MPPPLTSTWPHLRYDVVLEEGEYKLKLSRVTVVCTIIMVHKDMSSSYRSVKCILLGLVLCLLSASVSLVFMVL